MTTTTESKTINFDNGYGIYFDADDIGSANALVEMVNRHWDDIVAHMDRDIAESVHDDVERAFPQVKHVMVHVNPA